MTEITVESIKQLREQTGAPVMECRTALEESGGDIKKAAEILKKKGIERAEKKGARETKAGLIETYTHLDGRIGVMVEVFCETDFVARNDEFKKLVHELALQVASMDPKNVEALLKQPWIRDESETVGDLVKETIGKLGENIKISRFQRFELGK
jgi:elongation factor Ts